MAILKCKMCGGELEIAEETSVCECEYCGSKQTVPTVDDEKIIKLYDRANRLRMANEFDKAAGVYESIVAESDIEAEAYWGLVLCKFGIEYVDDPATGDKVPTCHRSSFDSVMEDSDFEMVMENADGISRKVYREQAKQIEEIRKSIIEVSGKEDPYDIFICYKETNDSGDRTVDSVMAQDVYDKLVAKGYRVFFSRITLEDKLGQEYEPYIFAALNSAKIMLAFGTDYDYYNAVWVKNEWSRYLKLMAKDKEKHLIPCYKDIDAYDIPKEFKHLQAQDMGKVGADQDLLRGIDKILRPEGSETTAGAAASANQQDIHAAVASVMASNVNSNVNALLERGFMTLEDGDFEKADGLFEEVLNQSPKCAEAYMGKLMVYYEMDSTKTFAEDLYEEFFAETERKFIELGYDIEELLEKHYSLFSELDESTIISIKNSFIVSVDTNLDCLKQYDKAHDYMEVYCALDNDSDSSSEQDDKYYQRYLQYATEDVHNKLNINNILQNLVEEARAIEEKKVQELQNKYSKEKVVKIIETASAYAKSLVGDEFDQIESEYQSALSNWQKECEEITREWPEKRQQLQANWKAECDTIKQKYEQDKKEADENNQKVRQAYEQAVSEYEGELARIDNQIRGLKNEIANLKGVFKGKQREEIQNNIMVLEGKKSGVKKPVLASYGKLISEPQLILPEQPEDRENPVLPEQPIRKEIDQIEDVINNLIDEFEKEGITVTTVTLSRKFIKLGSYKGKPITWMVLEEKEGKALLLSEKALDAIPFNEEYVETTWEQCTLRKWLNNDFLDEALGNEKSRICLTKVTADANPDYDTNPGNDTEDKIFLLSIKEVNEYFTEDEERICYPTEYVKTTALWIDDEEDARFYEAFWWWLRSPGFISKGAAMVYLDGSVRTNGNPVGDDFSAVRPALWLNLES